MNPQTPVVGNINKSPRFPAWMEKLLHHKWRFYFLTGGLVLIGGLAFLGYKMPWKSSIITERPEDFGQVSINNLITTPGTESTEPGSPISDNGQEADGSDNSTDGGTGGGAGSGSSAGNSGGSGGASGGSTGGDSSPGGGSTGLRFPTLNSVGVPAGWQPSQTYNGTYSVTTPGAVIEDMRINGTLRIRAANVTVRRVEVVGGQLQNYYAGYCANGLVIEDTSVINSNQAVGVAAISSGGYTARRVKIDNWGEGFRISSMSGGCGPVLIEDSYARVVKPEDCNGVDWHGDALQAYQGNDLTIRDSVLEIVGNFDEGCGGNAAFFYPDQGNTQATVDGLLVKGGGITFRMGRPGSVNDVYVVNNSWLYRARDVDTCGQLSQWSAYNVNLDANGQPVIISSLSCG